MNSYPTDCVPAQFSRSRPVSHHYRLRESPTVFGERSNTEPINMQFLSSLQVSFLKSESQEFRSLIDELYSLPMVRFAVINDSYGERLVGGMKPGVQSISPDESEKRLAMQSVIMLKMAEDFEKYTGELHYSTIRWDKMKAI